MSCIVTLLQGSVQGKECIGQNQKKYYSFEGIPYAKPPVEKLRFRDPQPPENWSGIRDATKPGPICAQMDSTGKNVIGSEDCLYLNVYTPILPDQKQLKLPVLFFVHGGKLMSGQGDYYKPDYFLQNDVILVTVNYRLHVLGLLCLHTPEVPGNAALKDTVMALRWLKNNIKFFNGDENNVTAFGESAGAGIVTSYLTSKMTDGLIHKIIAQSGVVYSSAYFREDDAVGKAKKLASILGKDLNDTKSIYDFLVNAPIKDLVTATHFINMSRPPHMMNSFFLPTPEKKFEGVDRFVEEYPYISFQQNRFKKLPLLIGVSSHEGALFLRKNKKGEIEYLKDMQLYYPQFLLLSYNSPKSIKLEKQLREFYFNNSELNDNVKEEYVAFMSDLIISRDVLVFAEYYSKYCNNTYLFNFCYSGNMNTRIMKSLGIKGATHGDIIQYQFYKPSKAANCDTKDEKVVKFLSEAWCNFASNGKPTWSNQTVEWKPYDSSNHLCLNIDEDLTLAPYPYWNRIKFWIDNMGERSKL